MKRALLVIGVLSAATPGWADEVDDWLRDIRAIGKEASGSKEARAAWDKLVARGPGVLPRVLQAMDTPDTAASNWLRTAFDRIVQAEKQRGGKGIDGDALLAFVQDARRQGRARRLALNVVEELRPGTRDRLLQGWLEDPEFRYDAIDLRLTQLDKETKSIEEVRKLFTASRDLNQARRVAAKLKSPGVDLSVADHLGFLRDWYVIGPFDAPDMKGFTTAYPPESKVDLEATHEGKGQVKLRWKRFLAPETPTGNHAALVNLCVPLGNADDAVGYAYSAFQIDKPQEVEFRGAADDNLTVFVNGKRVFGFEEYRNGVRLDRHRFRVALKEGVNTVLVKVVQAPTDPGNPAPNWEFLLRIVDLDGKGLQFRSALKRS